MVLCGWLLPQPEQVLQQVVVDDRQEPHHQDTKGIEDDDFDAILATRTRTSWDQDDAEFENTNDVSPDNSVGNPEEADMEVVDNASVQGQEDNEAPVLFPWPFNPPAAEQAADPSSDVDAYRGNAIDQNTSLPQAAQSESTKKIVHHLLYEVPFDEPIPRSDGFGVPFDDRLLCNEVETVKHAESVDHSQEGPPLMDLASKEETETFVVEECSGSLLPTVVEDDLSKKSRRVDADQKYGYFDKKNEMIETSLSQSPRVLLERSNAQGSIDNMFTNVESMYQRIDTRSDNIQDYHTLGAVNSFSQTASSAECTDAMMRNQSTEKDDIAMTNETPFDEIQASRSSDEDVLKTTRSNSKNKVFHPPSMHEKNTKIARDMEALEDPSFDDFQEIRRAESTNSILKCSKTPSHDESSATLSKRVSFAENLYETCPSYQSDLALDYMHHNFEDEGKPCHKNVIFEDNDEEESSSSSENDMDEDGEESSGVDMNEDGAPSEDEDMSNEEFEDVAYGKPHPWFEALVQAI